MMLAHSSRVQVPARSMRLARALDSDRLTSLGLAVTLVISLVGAGLTARRMVLVEREFQPALADSYRLAAALEATRVLLRDGRLGAADSRLARADSQAQRFHRIATATPRAQALAYDAAFGEYYVAARRAAVGISMSLDADGSSAEDASLGYTTLRGRLSAGVRSQGRAIEATRPATAPVELAGWLALALLSAAKMFRRSAAARQAMQAKATRAPRLDRHDPIGGSGEAPVIPLHDAVARLARTRLAASAAAAKVAKRNNERQIELARSWNAPLLAIVPAEPPMAEMDVYEDEPAEAAPKYERLALVTA